MESGILNLSPARLRHIIKEVSGKDMPTADAEVYLRVFGEQLEQEVLKVVRNTVRNHFGSR